MSTSKKQIELALERLSEVSGLPITRDEAQKKGADKFLHAEYANCYGGWRLVMVKLNSGAHSGAFGGNGTEPRMKPQEFYTYLNGLINGVECAKKLQTKKP